MEDNKDKDKVINNEATDFQNNTEIDTNTNNDIILESQQEEYSSMVNHNTMLLSFEGWIKYIEGFSRGLQTTKTVDAASVMDCVGEIMEYMRTLRQDLLGLLQHCEHILDINEQLEEENKQLKQQLNTKLLTVSEIKNNLEE